MGSTAFRCVWVVVVVLAVLSPTSAAVGAQQPPAIQYDPDSPAGTEYELPLPSARSAGGTAPADAPALFGAGISKRAPDGARAKPQGAAGAGSAARSPAGAGDAPGTDREGPAAVGDASSGGPAAVAAGAPAAVSQNGLLTGLASALLVLALGLGVLVVARRPHAGDVRGVRRR